MKFKYQKTRGFTIIETLVAISILSLSILATYTAVQGGLQKSNLSKDRIIAFYLAQEAIEYVKNIRDENAMHSLEGTSVDWLHGLSENSNDPCYFGKTCTIDSPMKTASACSGNITTCPYLKQDSTSGLMGYTSSWATTNFKRGITFTDITESVAVDEIKVTVTITWVNRGSTYSFTADEIIFSHE